MFKTPGFKAPNPDLIRRFRLTSSPLYLEWMQLCRKRCIVAHFMLYVGWYHGTSKALD